MGLIQQLAAEIEECEQAGDCLNSRANRGEQFQCTYCRLAKSGGGPMVCWKPWKKGTEHPVLVEEKKQASRAKREARAQKRRSKSRPKQSLLKRAARAEKTTELNFNNAVVSTVNSGRSNKDGDHTLAGRVTLDTKMQSGNVHPVVNLAELDKVIEDAKRAGNIMGGLVIRNKFDRGVIVFDEKYYARGIVMLGRAYARAILELEKE
jgi:hypothetical protein